RDVAGHAHPFERPRDPLRPHDLAVLAAELVLLALGAVDHPPRAPLPEVHLAVADLVSAGSPPVLQVLARGVRLEHEVPWCVEHPRDHDLPFRGCRERQGVTARRHVPSPFSRPGAPPGTRPAGRSSPPRIRGTAPPIRPPP